MIDDDAVLARPPDEAVYSPRQAADKAKRLGHYPARRYRVHGTKARYVPNLLPHSVTVVPASDHRAVRVEAWDVSTSDEAAQAVCALLATLPGATGSGVVLACDPDIGDRRPYAWVLLPGDATACVHGSERWTKGRS